MDSSPTDIAMIDRLRSMLVALARQQERMAEDEVAATPYWAPCSASVLGHRAAAAALRAEVDVLPATS